MKITQLEGSGGKETADLINSVFKAEFSNPVLDLMEDSAVLPSSERIAFTTDSYVITPLFFGGTDIGRLAVCGTVNDLLMRGAEPKYISAAFIIEEGMESETLKKIAHSMAKTAKEAGVTIVCGDTKVVEGNGGLSINTAGIGFLKASADIASRNITPGDSIILSGALGAHYAAVTAARLGIESEIKSDAAPLNEMVLGLLNAGVTPRAMRDVTRGGLATILNELAEASGTKMEITATAIPEEKEVGALSEILGLDTLHMSNEGRLVAIVKAEDENKALQIIKNAPYGADAAVIGKVEEGSGVTLKTAIGGVRRLNPLIGGGLPRIC